MQRESLAIVVFDAHNLIQELIVARKAVDVGELPLIHQQAIATEVVPYAAPISRNNGPCIHMQCHRLDGCLVVEVIPVPSQNYLLVQRVDDRLLLSFIDSTYGDEPGYEFGDASVCH
ncbi:protein FAF-like, chloroplastic [Canna indica]|uniref:Protein FAF-like, chloroplastic n=1 Tax=Canna indica TaxID=4628 RepID=A0AAQ3KQZ3_9LILI|nr:protein FAF-like, chloroplastic [Canna indica]